MRKTWVRRITASATLAALAAITMVGATGVAGAQTDDDPPSRDDPRVITVNGTGLVSGTPDVLELYLGVDTRGDTAGEALAQNSRLTVGVLEVLRDAGVPEKDIQTTNLSIYPVYDDDGEVVIAYSVSNRVVAKLRDLNTAGDIIDEATKAAGDDIIVQGLYFSIDDNSKVVEQARTEAVKRGEGAGRAARRCRGRRAGCAALDRRALHADRSRTGRGEAAAPTAESGDAASVPIQPGSEELSVDVTLVYEIG